MAYTITNIPPDSASVHGDLIYVVSETDHTSDPVTYPNYKFIADVYVGATLVARLKKVPDPVNEYGVFNIGQIVRNYISTTFSPDAGLLAQTLGDGEFNVTVQVKFGEEYSYTEFLNLTETETAFFYNTYNDRNYTSTFLLIHDRALTNRPFETTIRCDSAFNFIGFWPTTEDDFDILITSYEDAGNVLDTVSQTPTFTVNDLLVFNVSVGSLNAITPGFINDSVSYFTVEFITTVPDAGSVHRFNLKCECQYEVFTLHFLNKFGSFESKDFTKVSRNTISIEKKDFGKLPYVIDGDGVLAYRNGNSVYFESRSVYSSQFKEKMALNSDFITDAEYRWLRELIVSPMVYLEEDSSFYPVVIVTTDYEEKKIINDDLTNLTINIEFGNQLNAQYR